LVAHTNLNEIDLKQRLLLIFEEKLLKIGFISSPPDREDPQPPSEGVQVSHSFLKDNKNNGKASWKSELGQTRAHWARSAHRNLLRANCEGVQTHPDQYIRSTRLREWARRNKNSKYIPEALLEAWALRLSRRCSDFSVRSKSAAFGWRFSFWGSSFSGTGFGFRILLPSGSASSHRVRSLLVSRIRIVQKKQTHARSPSFHRISL